MDTSNWVKFIINFWSFTVKFCMAYFHFLDFRSWVVSQSEGHTFRFPPCLSLDRLWHRPQDMIYFIKAMTNFISIPSFCQNSEIWPNFIILFKFTKFGWISKIWLTFGNFVFEIQNFGKNLVTILFGFNSKFNINLVKIPKFGKNSKIW